MMAAGNILSSCFEEGEEPRDELVAEGAPKDAEGVA